MPERLDLPDDELARLYQEGVSAYALGLRYGCTSNTIGKRLRAQGITVHRTSARVRAITRDELEQLIGRGLSDAQVARRFNVCHATVRKLRHGFGLLPHPKHRKRSTKDTKGTNGLAADGTPAAMGGTEQ
ncbi:MAG TPA: hypothetical protein VFS21_17760 [Roseiflexaceae bacterium]|nr:hypothetical protein [Roseiflexaceae bacterium]